MEKKKFSKVIQKTTDRYTEEEEHSFENFVWDNLKAVLHGTRFATTVACNFCRAHCSCSIQHLLFNVTYTEDCCMVLKHDSQSTACVCHREVLGAFARHSFALYCVAYAKTCVTNRTV